MSQHLPECGQRSTPLPHFIGVCICQEIKQAERRLLSEVGLVLKGIPDKTWIAKNSDQAFNVKWYVIEKVEQIGGKP